MSDILVESDDLDRKMSNEIQIPSTPPPGRPSSSPSPVDDGAKQSSSRARFVSPPPPSSSMTPPPSTQPPRFYSPPPQSGITQSDVLLASPPATIKYNMSVNLPTPEYIAGASIDELRTLAQDLLLAVRDSRMSAAHFKLQHSLLTMETEESAQRAEVEHQMTRREVEVLQNAEQRQRATPRNSQPPSNPQIETLTKICKDLEEEKDELERRLRRAKKLIESEKDKAELLFEENLLLKKRIRDNREHFTRMKSQSPLYPTSRDTFSTPQRKAVPRFDDTTPSHAPFAALLAADQVLSGESLSVPSTPTKSQVSKLRAGHTRGAHSLSSLATTPRARTVTGEEYTDSRLAYSAPGSQLVSESAERGRYDRDSTISVSDEEDALSDDDVPQSQASSLATNMLRKNPGSQESLRLSQSAEHSSNLLQTKLFGNVKKHPAEKVKQGKRHTSFGEGDITAKKAKLREGVGLGIGTWGPKV